MAKEGKAAKDNMGTRATVMATESDSVDANSSSREERGQGGQGGEVIQPGAISQHYDSTQHPVEGPTLPFSRDAFVLISQMLEILRKRWGDAAVYFGRFQRSLQ